MNKPIKTVRLKVAVIVPAFVLAIFVIGSIAWTYSGFYTCTWPWCTSTEWVPTLNFSPVSPGAENLTGLVSDTSKNLQQHADVSHRENGKGQDYFEATGSEYSHNADGGKIAALESGSEQSSYGLSAQSLPYYDFTTVPPPLLHAIESVLFTPRARKIYAVCGGYACGGLSDRFMGLQTLVHLASATGRQLVVDKSIFGIPTIYSGLVSPAKSGGLGKETNQSRRAMRYIDWDCVNIVRDVLRAEEDMLIVQNNCLYLSPQLVKEMEPPLKKNIVNGTLLLASITASESTPGENTTTRALGVLHTHCTTPHDCAVAALMMSGTGGNRLRQAHALATGLLDSWLSRDYDEDVGVVHPLRTASPTAVNSDGKPSERRRRVGTRKELSTANPQNSIIRDRDSDFLERGDRGVEVGKRKITETITITAENDLNPSRRSDSAAVVAKGNSTGSDRHAYTVLHVRCGGSKLRVDQAVVSALKIADGYDTSYPQLFLDYLGELRRSGKTYPGHVAIVSDSARFTGEAFAVSEAHVPNLLRCCFPQRHVDKTSQHASFPLQEIVDLIVLSRASLILATSSGKYPKLASVFTKFSTAPTPTVVLEFDKSQEGKPILASSARELLDQAFRGNDSP